MNPTNLKINDLIVYDPKLTFLIGAGCSIDPPSCLPAGQSMMEKIINYTCVESEKEKIKKLKDLRFEQLVEIFRDNVDPELKIIDYYSQCNQPNNQHFFLAEMIKKDNFVMTTNFDYLIEHALIQSGIPKTDIIPVITKEDFENYNDPNKLLKKGKKTLYKIHGSTKNLITKEKTKEALIATIQAFGSNKEGMNVFQLEPFKRTLFENITKNRSLIIMGYSGSDDFDVVPTLKVLKNLKNVIWINHIFNDDGKEKIYEINASEIEGYVKIDKINEILVDIKRMEESQHVYRIDVNTSRLMKEFLKTKPNLSQEKFSSDPFEFFENNLDRPDEFKKLYIPYKIYHDFDMFDDALRCCMEICRLAKQKNDNFWKVTAVSNIGQILSSQGRYEEALKHFEEALKIALDNKYDFLMVSIINRIGWIFYSQGKYEKALKQYINALRYYQKTNNLSNIANCFNQIGLIYHAQSKYDDAIKNYRKALKISEELGSLSFKAALLNNLGEIHRTQGMYPEALKKYEEALLINEKLCDFSGRANCLNNIGMTYYHQGFYNKALKNYEDALKIDKQLNNLSGKLVRLQNIGKVYSSLGEYEVSLKKCKKSLLLAQKLKVLSEEGSVRNDIGVIYFNLRRYEEANKFFKEALEIHTNLKDLSGVKVCKINIGMFYEAQKKYDLSLKYYKEALEIAEKLNELPEKATILNNIASVYHYQKNYNDALNLYEYVLKIQKELKNSFGIANCLNNIGMIYKKQKEYSLALNYCKDASDIAMNLENKTLLAKILYNLGLINIDLGKPQIASDYFEEVVKIDPSILRSIAPRFSILEHPEYGIEFEYPSEWKIIRTETNWIIHPPDAKKISIPDSNAQILSPSINIQVGIKYDANINDLYSSLISNQERQYIDYKLVEEYPPIENEFGKWIIRFTKNNHSFKAIYILLYKNSKIILLNASCVESEFKKWEWIFNQIIQGANIK